MTGEAGFAHMARFSLQRAKERLTPEEYTALLERLTEESLSLAGSWHEAYLQTDPGARNFDHADGMDDAAIALADLVEGLAEKAVQTNLHPTETHTHNRESTP